MLKMIIRWILIWILLFSGAVFHGQSQTIISGIVLTENNETLPGANVYIEGSYDGTSTNPSGFFSFKTFTTDTFILRASYIGFMGFSKELSIGNQDSIYLEIILQEHINYLNEVVISAGTFEAGTNSKSEVLRPLDIVTTAGVTADVPGALNTLPGTQTVGEQGRLFVRGGDAYETTTFIDGMIVKESYEINAPQTPTRSRFSPFMFSGTSFSTGGYSAEYGQGLSSALILDTKDVATETRTDFSIISVGLEAAHTQLWDEASLAAKLSYTDLDPYFHIIKQDFDWIDPPTSLDGNLAFRKKIGRDGLFKSYAKFNFSGMRFNHDPFITDEGLINTQLDNQYVYINNSFKDVLSDKWSLKTGISYSYFNNDILLDQDDVHERNTGYHIKSVAGYDHSDRVFFKFGGEIMTNAHFQDFQDNETGFENRFSFSEKITSLFLESKLFFTKTLLARVGSRIEYNTLSDNISVDPRLSLALKTGNNSQISFAYGAFRQTPPNDLKRVAYQLSPEKATHLIINYQWIKDNRTFRIEAFNKEYDELVVYDPVSINQSGSYKNAGSGYARGYDIFFRDGESFRNIDFLG